MQGGWGLLDIGAKCQALLLGSLWIQSTREGSATATWLQEWNLAGSRETPLYVRMIPKKLMYLHCYALDMAYIKPSGNNETLRTFKRRVYGTLHIVTTAAKEAENNTNESGNKLEAGVEKPTHSLGTRRNQIQLVRSST